MAEALKRVDAGAAPSDAAAAVSAAAQVTGSGALKSPVKLGNMPASERRETGGSMSEPWTVVLKHASPMLEVLCRLRAG